MALRIKAQDATVGARCTPGARLWLTRDRSRLVPDGHEDAAALYCSEFASVQTAEFEQLIEASPDVELVLDEPEPAPKASKKRSTKKQSKKSSDKEAKAGANKAEGEEE